MPHVIIAEGPGPRAYYETFESRKTRLPDGTVLETRAAYLRRDEQVVLVQALCLELGPAQNFFVAVERKRRQVTVRLHPHPSPERTPGVKALVAQIGREVLALGGRLEATNIDELRSGS